MSPLCFPKARFVRNIRLLLAALSFGCWLGGARADRHWYFAPVATGDKSGSSPANARPFEAASVNYDALGNQSDPVAVLHFAPGIYSLRTYLTSMSRADHETLTIRLRGEGERPEDTVIRNDKPLVLYTEDRMLRMNGMGRIELENLTFDGNWDEKMKEAGHPAFNPNYKNQPISLTARTGRVRRVIVRNCGSIGFIPQSHYDNSAGTEAFPLALGTTDIGQEPAPGDPAPWVVEDCEIHGFHPEYNGYTTLLMSGGDRINGATPAWAGEDPARRTVLVRRCQVRGVPGGAGIIALGSAGCGAGEVNGGRVTYTDNIILNASLGFNTDCGRLVNFEAVNSMFLDVWTVGNIGALYPGTMDGYRVSGNAVRLSGRAPHPTYSNFKWNGGRAVTDPTLMLGRSETNEVSGLGSGAAGRLRWEGNWFTTRPRDQFAPEGVAPTFRLLRKYTAADTSFSGAFSDITSLSAAGNGLSSVAWDFTRVGTLPGGNHPNFGPATVPELTQLRTVAADGPENFRPIGTVERVLPVQVARSQTFEWRAAPASAGGPPQVHRVESVQPVLAGALEVSIGQPRLEANGELRLSARLALQPLPGAGWPGTVPQRGSNLWLEVSGPVTARFAGITDSRGVAEFRVAASEVKPGRLEMRAYHDPTARTTAEGSFREYRVAFATATHAIGTMVLVEASPNFAQAGGQRARFRLTRTGRTLAELPEAEVYFRLGTDIRPARYGEEFEMAVTGAAKSNLEGLAHGGVGRLTFAAGDRSAAIEVIPLPLASERSSLVQVRLLAGAAQKYGVDAAPATILLHHGPEWVYEALPTGGANTVRITAMGPSVIAGKDTAVFAVGTRRDASGQETGVLWRRRLGTQGWEDVSALVPDFAGVQPVAVGRPMLGQVPVIAGNRTTASGVLPWSNGNHALDLPAGVKSARVVAMSDDAGWLVGVIGGAGSRRAVVWREGEPALVVALPDGAGDAEPVGIDAEGRVAGNAKSGGRSRGFRTQPHGAGPVEWLAGPDAAAEVRVSDLSMKGVAVGWSGAGTTRRAVAWLPAAAGAVAAPLELGRPDNLPEAAAFAINPGGEAVGVAGRGGQLTDLYKVVAVANGPWKPLADQHFVSGLPPGFEAGVPVGINDQGWVAGNGRSQGKELAWVLRRPGVGDARGR